MAATFVQGAIGNAGGFDTFATSSGITTTAGNPAFIFVISALSGTSVSDSKGNTWTPIGGNITTSDGVMGRLWYCAALVGAGSGHTAGYTSGSTFGTVFFLEFTGTIDTASIGSIADNGAPWTVTSGSFIDADELAVVFVGGGNSSGTEVYAASGYTKALDQPDSNWYTACVFTKQLASSSAETATVTLTSGTVNTTALFILGVRSPSGGAAALAADAAAVATLTGVLSTSIWLAATPASVATTTAALTTQKRLNATPGAVATATAALTTQKRLNAAPQAVATMTAALTAGSAGAALAASAVATSAMTAALTTSIRLSAAAQGIATASATMTGGTEVSSSGGTVNPMVREAREQVRRANAKAKRKQEEAERQKLEADQKALRDQAVEAERAADEARVQAEKDAVAAALRQIQERSKVATLPPEAPPAPELPALPVAPEPKKPVEQSPPKAEPTVDLIEAAETEATGKRRALIQENNRRTMLLAAMLMLEVA